MRVAILHYHLRPGGVTRVIESAARALAGSEIKAVVLCGESSPPDVEIAAPVCVVPGLDYAPGGAHPAEDDLIKAMESAAVSAIGGTPDLWHIHNHALGKNAGLTRAVERMARRGKRLLLQIHDFAEDGRPHLFETLMRYVGNNDIETLGRIAYPVAGHIHYACINRRDTRLLMQAGAPETTVHYLPNAIAIRPGQPHPWEPQPATQRLILYPVRAIRRKNLGEALLWCGAMKDQSRLAVTLAPKSPADRAAYDDWVNFAQSLSLPVEFEAGQRSSSAFEEQIASAWLVLTTSVAEGFGLTFLEPWLAGRPVVGRDIPEITQDFKDNGILLPALYPALNIPIEWLDRQELESRIRDAYSLFLARYNRQPTPENLAAAVRGCITGNAVDFGRLDEPLQKRVIERLLRNPADIRHVRPSSLVSNPDVLVVALQRNAALIRRTYGLDAYRNRLRAIYEAVLNAAIEPIQGALSVNHILDFFLAPETFRLIRT